jgi:hypothetical protein
MAPKTEFRLSFHSIPDPIPLKRKRSATMMLSPLFIYLKLEFGVG